jgi:hypothetical protein
MKQLSVSRQQRDQSQHCLMWAHPMGPPERSTIRRPPTRRTRGTADKRTPFANRHRRRRSLRVRGWRTMDRSRRHRYRSSQFATAGLSWDKELRPDSHPDETAAACRRGLAATGRCRGTGQCGGCGRWIRADQKPTWGANPNTAVSTRQWLDKRLAAPRHRS